MNSKMKTEGRRMLSNLITRRRYKFERIVKLGDPSIKIAEIAQELDVDTLILGGKGLVSTDSNMGHGTCYETGINHDFETSCTDQ